MPAKAKKDGPKGPKRALSAFMYFSMDKRPTVKAENPDATFGGLGKLIGVAWAGLTAAEKQPYMGQAAEDKNRYLKELEESGGVMPGGKKRKAANTGPKRALSSFMYFAQDQRATIKQNNPDAGFGEIGKLIGKEWGKLSTADKQPYADKATKDKQRYVEEKAEEERKAKKAKAEAPSSDEEGSGSGSDEEEEGSGSDNDNKDDSGSGSDSD